MFKERYAIVNFILWPMTLMLLLVGDNSCRFEVYSLHATILFCSRKLQVSLKKP